LSLEFLHRKTWAGRSQSSLVDQAVAGVTVAGLTIAVGEIAAAFGSGSRSPLAGLGRALIGAGRERRSMSGSRWSARLSLGVGPGSPAREQRFWPPGRPRTRYLLARRRCSAARTDCAFGRPSSGDRDRRSVCAVSAAAAAAHVTRAGMDKPRQDQLGAAGTLLFAAGVAVAARGRRRTLDERARRRWTLPLSAQTMRRRRPAPSGLAPLLSGSVEMYQVDVTFPAPRVDGHSWRLKVHGDVNIR